MLKPDCDGDGAAALAGTGFNFDCAPPLLTARFLTPQRTLGWSLLYPGFAAVREIVWVEVKDNDLGPILIRAPFCAHG